MKTLLVLSVAFLLVATGAFDSVKQKRKTAVLSEMVSFTRFIKGELQYRAADFESLSQSVKSENYKYIKADDKTFYITEARDKAFSEHFKAFMNHLGTTDRDGQVNLCDEYIEKFTDIFNEHKQNEKSKIQINTALSVFGALCIVILFI